MSVPMPSGAHLKPIEAPSPPEEPPGVRVRLCGLSVVPVMLLLQQRCWVHYQWRSLVCRTWGVLTIRDWGWLVRTWKIAPALVRSWRRCASSVVTLSTLSYELTLAVIFAVVGGDIPSYIAGIASPILEANMLFHTDRHAVLRLLDSTSS